MTKANSFKDKAGNRGTIGSKVYHWHYDVGERASEELKQEKAQIVEDIVRQGAGGTKLKLTGERVYVPSRDYVILD